MVGLALFALAIGTSAGIFLVESQQPHQRLLIAALAFIGIVGLFWVSLLFLRHPSWLYGAMLWAIAIAPMFQLNGGDTPVSDAIRLLAYGLALIIILVAIYWTLKRPQDLILIPADAIIVLLLLWQFISLLVTDQPAITSTIAIANMLAILSCTLSLRLFVIRNYITGKEILVFLHLLAISVTVLGLLLLLSGPVTIGPFVFGNYALRSGFPIISIYPHGNTLGGRLFVGLIATCGLWRISESRKGRIYYFASAAIMSALLISSFSRSAYLGFAIGAAIIFWRGEPKWPKIAAAVGGILILAVAYQIIRSDPDWAYRFKVGSGGIRDRSVIWLAYWQQLKHSPITGLGFSTIFHEGRYVSAHNAYLGITVQFGFAALLLFTAAYSILMVMATLSQRLRTSFSPSIAWIFYAMTIAISIQQLFEAQLFAGVKYPHLVFWISITLATMPYIAQKRRRRAP